MNVLTNYFFSHLNILNSNNRRYENHNSTEKPMHCLKGSPGILVLLFYFVCLWSEIACGPKMKRCEKCECDDINFTVNCNSVELEFIPLYFSPNLRELRASDSRLRSLKLYNNYKALSYLDVSNNELEDLLSGMFIHLVNLETFLVNRNMISSLNNQTFVGLTKLKILHLNENLLEKLLPKVFSPLNSLENLDLSGNRIRFVDTNAFHGLNSLKSLLLRDNKLSSIPSQSFRNIPKLLSLDLGLNPIERELANDSFVSLPNLKFLMLDGCALRHLNSAVFRNLTSLLILRLDDNNLIEIPTECLQHVLRLEELFLSQNLFREVPARAFRRLKHLRRIVISGSTVLETIKNRAFEDNADLEYVEFDHNKKLSNIELGAFSGLANLRNVTFRGNAFKTFDSSVLSWDELEYMNVSNNPLKCDCNVLWLRNLLKSQNSTDKVLCSSPQQLNQRHLVNISMEDLECDDVNGRRQIVIGIAVSAAVIIALLATLGFKYRTKIAGVLKNRWGGTRKEPQYQKTNSEEENTILQAAQQSLKMTPVTEL